MIYLAFITVRIQDYPDSRREEKWTRLIEADSVDLAKEKVDKLLESMSDQYGTTYRGDTYIPDTIV